MKKFFVTTPLYYVNAPPHIGHAYTTLAADILVRYKRMHGAQVHLLTGTDEHGSKVEAMAKEAGKSPLDYADAIAGKFQDLWAHLDVKYDDFIRTTEKRHEDRVAAVFSRLIRKGDIYKGTYRGFYCVSCETYWTETEALAEKGKKLCPNSDCHRPLSVAEEESYFFKLSEYQESLLKHYREHPEFLKPSHRANEILRFVEAGLRDLAVSRSKVSWGIPVPQDPKHVVYVWFDALLNYITAAGYAPEVEAFSGQPEEFKALWPADVHMVGKEIYRFHAVIWPAMLMALGLPLPSAVFAHGWWTVEGDKMSKSKGNFVDPWEITREFGVDAFRYFLFREMPFGNDGDFSREALRKRYNAELANDLGNLVSRVANMVDKYLAGELPGKPDPAQRGISHEVRGMSKDIDSAMERLAFQDALNLVWSAVRSLNEHVNREAPWKKPAKDPSLKPLLFDWVWAIRRIAGWIAPFMPQTAAKMQAQLGVRQFPSPLTPEEVLHGPSGAKINKGPALFPRK